MTTNFINFKINFFTIPKKFLLQALSEGLFISGLLLLKMWLCFLGSSLHYKTSQFASLVSLQTFWIGNDTLSYIILSLLLSMYIFIFLKFCYNFDNEIQFRNACMWIHYLGRKTFFLILFN